MTYSSGYVSHKLLMVLRRMPEGGCVQNGSLPNVDAELVALKRLVIDAGWHGVIASPRPSCNCKRKWTQHPRCHCHALIIDRGRQPAGMRPIGGDTYTGLVC